MKKSLLKVDRKFSKNPEIFKKSEKIIFLKIKEKSKKKNEKSKIVDFDFFENFRDFLKNFGQL